MGVYHERYQHQHQRTTGIQRVERGIEHAGQGDAAAFHRQPDQQRGRQCRRPCHFHLDDQPDQRHESGHPERQRRHQSGPDGTGVADRGDQHAAARAYARRAVELGHLSGL